SNVRAAHGRLIAGHVDSGREAAPCWSKSRFRRETPVGLGQTCLALASSAAAPAPRPPALAPPPADFFLTLILWRRRKRQTALQRPPVASLRGHQVSEQ